MAQSKGKRKNESLTSDACCTQCQSSHLQVHGYEPISGHVLCRCLDAGHTMRVIAANRAGADKRMRED